MRRDEIRCPGRAVVTTRAVIAAAAAAKTLPIDKQNREKKDADGKPRKDSRNEGKPLGKFNVLLPFNFWKYNKKVEPLEPLETTNLSSEDLYRIALTRFTVVELEMVQKIYKELAARNIGRGINKETFLQYFPLPGMWGERMFVKFDYKSKGAVDYEAFVLGLALCCRGTAVERAHVIFQLFDLDNDGKLSKGELVVMFYAIRNLRELLYKEGNGENCASFEKCLDIEDFVDEILMNNEKEIGFNEFKTWLNNHDLLLAIFSAFLHGEVWGHNGNVMHKHFCRDSSSAYLNTSKSASNLQALIDSQYNRTNLNNKNQEFDHEAIHKLFNGINDLVHRGDDVIHNKELQCPNCALPFSKCPRCHIGCLYLNISRCHISMICDDCVDGERIRFTKCWDCNWRLFQAVDMCSDSRRIVLQGILYKVGRRLSQWQTRYYILVGNMLYCYSHQEAEMPKAFIFLEGCYVEEVKQASKTKLSPDKIRYGLSICHAGPSKYRRDFYADSEEARLEWIEALREAIGQSNVEEHYFISEQFTRGRFSRVYRGYSKATGRIVAIKKIETENLSSNARDLMRTEIAILRILRHPHVVTLIDLFYTKSNMYIVMEHVEGGELSNLVSEGRYLFESQAKKVVTQLLYTVGYIHKCGVVHRDIKLSNILMTNSSVGVGDIKLADFGLSCMCGPKQRVTYPYGTVAYAAPETLAGTGYNHKADIWSIGIIMYVLICGKFPFNITEIKEEISKNKSLSHLFSRLSIEGEIWDKVSHEGKDLLQGLLTVDPESRLTIDKALSHDWIKGGILSIQSSM